jgi:hypothetical protein
LKRLISGARKWKHWWNLQGQFASVRTLWAALERTLELQPTRLAVPRGRRSYCWVIGILPVGFRSYVCGRGSAVWNIGAVVCLPGSSIAPTHASCAHAFPYTYHKPIVLFPSRTRHWSLNNCHGTPWT